MTMICAGCGYIAPPLEPRPFRCPNAGSDDIDHVLRRNIDLRGAADAFFDAEPDPFVRYRRLTHAWATAMAMGMTDGEYVALVRGLEPSFRITPLIHRDDLWIKDETGNVAGSHKGRHLMGLRIWIEIMKLPERRLAIASCGNAALAAAVVAHAAGRDLDVFVPTDAPASVIARLEALGARVTRCARQPGVTGDPAYHRFREAVAEGALPFTCQGNENGMVIEGGQTLGWEMVSQLLASSAAIDRLFVQVGGGALASACIAAFDDAYDLGLIPERPRIHAVQTAASPLARAWDCLETSDSSLDFAIHHRSRFMWPWETAPASIAHGILDDETYDWVAVMRGMIQSGGFPVTVSEDQLTEANRLARATGIPVDPTGSSGLAGVLELKRRGEIRSGESLGVLFTGRSHQA
jgi:threonine synthase